MFLRRSLEGGCAAALAVLVSGIAVTTNGAPRPGWSADETSVQNFGAQAVSATGLSLDPTTIPKYVIPLVIPPVMDNDGEPDNYDIAVREFKQQILPGGIWNLLNGRNDKFKPTTVWSYGPAADASPEVAPDPNSQFNYPAYTIETISDFPVDVKWINDLVDENGNFLPHLLPIDQTLHWANPPAGPGNTDSVGMDPEPYAGPVPIVTHVHGAHVDPHSDGYPEAWWLPAASNIPNGYATMGTLFDDKTGANPGNLGYAEFYYRQDQPATTLWYHDHALGMTRNNVYAGPAGFWIIRGGDYDGATDSGTGDEAVLPGPAPVAGQGVLELNVPGDPVRNSIREIPIVIQDRSFKRKGRDLFYPEERAFFEGVKPSHLKIPFAPESDVAPIWNPEAFFDVMVVNGVSWPQLTVAPALYRLRLLNGCNSRFLWLKFDDPEVEVYQIGAEQGFLAEPILMNDLNLDESGDGTAQLLMALAERADVIVDFRGLAHGTEILLTNLGPDDPFGGGIPGDDFDAADPETTGQVMRFVVDSSLDGASPTDPSGATPATDPADLVLNTEPPLGDAAGDPRNVSLNEEESHEVCVLADEDSEEYLIPIREVDCDSEPPDDTIVVPFGPTAALLGLGVGVERTVNVPAGPVDIWVTENPALGATEEWDIYNFTVDAHPIHLHLVRFEVVKRQAFGEAARGPEPWESAYKDTVIAYPGEITTVKALFDLEGLYVWHCHIVEHEDNEMMRPYYVGD
ncbi:MAG: multicopper oxidase family protein [Planctomycetota bacterium]|jgi:FtsP/CotA-like multicopper oxidase with cupredoxin domain